MIIIQACNQLPQDDAITNVKSQVRSLWVERATTSSLSVDNQLSQEQHRTISLARDKGASGWLNVLPLQEEGFCLNKEEFRDALALRYNKYIPDLPSICPCGKSFDPYHAMECKKGGFIHARHDQIRNLEAALLSEVCNDVSIEPPLQPVTGEEFALRSTNTEGESRLDVKARGFYRHGQSAFFDIRVAHLNAASYKSLPTHKILSRHENEKKREYNRRVIEIEQAVFTPLVFGQMVRWVKNVRDFTRFLLQSWQPNLANHTQ